MAKKGMSPSQIGIAIRDKEAVPSIKLLTGQKIVRLLKKNGIYYNDYRMRPINSRRCILPDKESSEHSKTHVEMQKG